MPKKTTKKIVHKPLEYELEVSIPEKATSISPLSASFANEDMNKVVEKINEIVAHLNGVL